MTTRFVIIGGGISGLCVAHRLTELHRARGLSSEITVLEASDRFGGVIETQRREGFLLEGGPDAFITDKPWALDLCRRLGIAEQLVETQEPFRRSFVIRRGRLVPVPEGWYLIAPARLATLLRSPLVTWRGKLRMACEPLIPPRAASGDESVGAFIRRRFGVEALRRVGQPMIGGIYTADPERLSLQATFPRFAEMERRHGSVLRGLRAGAEGSSRAVRRASGPRYSVFLALRGGLSTLVHALMARMPEASLRLRSAVTRIAPGRGWTVTLRDGASLTADAVCLALPAHPAAALLRDCAPALSQELSGIPYESVATVNVAFRRADVRHPLDGFGFVAPAVERRRLVGCTFTSVKFPGRAPEGQVLLRAFVGGATHHELLAFDDEGLARVVLDELRDVLGLRGQPLFASVRRFPRAMPQYHIGHLDRVGRIEQLVSGYPGLSLTGNGYRGLGIPDCVHQAEDAAERMGSAHLAA